MVLSSLQEKETSEILHYVVQNNISVSKKWVKCFWEIHYLGIQGRGKGHKVKHLKIILKKIFDGEFGIHGKFPLRI